MPFDGVSLSVVTREMESKILGAKIDKIYQPETDEVVLRLRTKEGNVNLLLCANPSRARVQLTNNKPETPLDPPAFCMLLRKQLGAGRIAEVKQISFDRVFELKVETLSEMGDPVTRILVLEMMGKHSNLILVDENDTILDAVRRVSPMMSSLRTVQPGFPYERVTPTLKKDPREIMSVAAVTAHAAAEAAAKAAAFAAFDTAMTVSQQQSGGPTERTMYQAFYGFSPRAGGEVISRSRVNGQIPYTELEAGDKQQLYETFCGYMQELSSAAGPYYLYLDDTGKAVDFTMMAYASMTGLTVNLFETTAELLDDFYARQGKTDKTGQKAQELRHLIKTNIDRVQKKKLLQEKQLEDTATLQDNRIKGDILMANLYQLSEGAGEAVLPNFYAEGSPEIKIRLDRRKTPAQNAQAYYERYNKQKRTQKAVTEQLEASREELSYLESVLTSLELSDCEKDLADVRSELELAGYVRHHPQKKDNRKKNLKASEPIRFTTSEGVEGLIGKNNIQNDQLTFKTARDSDLWFHVKDIPGSHVILRVADLKEGQDYTEKSLLEAAAQAAAHSQGKTGNNVPVDFAKRMYVKKPSGAKPGFVRYTHQTTIYVKAADMESGSKR